MSKNESGQMPPIISRRKLLIGGAIAGLGLGIPILSVALEKTGQPRAPKNLAEALAIKDWKALSEPKTQAGLKSLTAQAYTNATSSPRLTAEQVAQNTHLFTNTRDFTTKGATLNPYITPDYQPTEYADFDTKQVLINLEGLSRLPNAATPAATVFGRLLSQWLSVDLEPRKGLPSGFLDSRVDEQTTFRGISPIIEGAYALPRLDSTIRETISLMIQLDLKLKDVSYNTAFYTNGSFDLVRHCLASGIKVTDLYALYSTSDAEGLAKLLGAKLLAEGEAVEKGLGLFRAVEQNDSAAFEHTGIYKRFPKSKTGA